MAPFRRLIKPVTAIALAFTVMGCQTAPIVTDKAYPPVDLVQDCSVPAYRVRTNSDLAEAIILLKAAITHCNNDKAALRAWMED